MKSLKPRIKENLLALRRLANVGLLQTQSRPPPQGVHGKPEQERTKGDKAD